MKAARTAQRFVLCRLYISSVSTCDLVNRLVEWFGRASAGWWGVVNLVLEY
jgi:hypothetical protein